MDAGTVYDERKKSFARRCHARQAAAFRGGEEVLGKTLTSSKKSGNPAHVFCSGTHEPHYLSSTGSKSQTNLITLSFEQ